MSHFLTHHGAMAGGSLQILSIYLYIKYILSLCITVNIECLKSRIHCSISEITTLKYFFSPHFEYFGFYALIGEHLIGKKATYNCRIMGSVWVLFFFLSVQDPYILHFLQAIHIQPASKLQLFLSNSQ